MLTQHRLSDDSYHSAVSILGETQLIELVIIIGYYTTVSMTLNAFDIPLREGITIHSPRLAKELGSVVTNKKVYYHAPQNEGFSRWVPTADTIFPTQFGNCLNLTCLAEWADAAAEPKITGCLSMQFSGYCARVRPGET